jgi:hypothetical protein
MTTPTRAAKGKTQNRTEVWPRTVRPAATRRHAHQGITRRHPRECAPCPLEPPSPHRSRLGCCPAAGSRRRGESSWQGLP